MPTDPHAMRARTDMGTRADTSVQQQSAPNFTADPLHPPSASTLDDPSPPAASSGSAVVNHHHLLNPSVLHQAQPAASSNHSSAAAASENSPVPKDPPLAVGGNNSIPANPQTANPNAPDRNRRLSLDGDLPPGAIRPDDRRDDSNDGEETMSEGIAEVYADSFLPAAIDVSACSKAGWEPVRGPVPSVPPSHTVEVRKENQDAFCVFAPFIFDDSVIPDEGARPDPTGVTVPPSGHHHQIFLGVFDGHGAQGRPIAHFARDYISSVSRDAAAALSSCVHFGVPVTNDTPPVANTELHRARLDLLRAAFSRAERALTESECGIDHVFSGTTAVVTWMFGREVYTAWTGDSRCVIGRMVSPENGRIRFKAVELSHDQKPVRADEKRRVRNAGGRIARWQRNMGPLRVWLPRDWTPGLAMTRSIGDTVLSEYGVSPVPEVSYTTVGAADSFIVLASDGVWEFMTSQEVVDFVGRMRREGRPADEASEGLVREAVRRWRRHEVVVDDTTAVVMYMSWEDDDVTIEEGEKKMAEALLSKSRKVFSRTRAKVSLKPASLGVHLVSDDGQLTDFVCKNDLFQGL